MTRNKKGYIYLVVFLISNLSGCKRTIDFNYEIEKWVKKNENSIYKQVNRSLTFEINTIHNNSNLNSETFVFTEFDSTILGTLAFKVKEIDTCLLTKYKIYHKNVKLDLIIAKPIESDCRTKNTFTKDTIDLKYFRLIFT